MSACQKTAFATERAALDRLLAITARSMTGDHSSPTGWGHQPTAVYPCRSCGGVWHLTSSDRWGSALVKPS